MRVVELFGVGLLVSCVIGGPGGQTHSRNGELELVRQADERVQVFDRVAVRVDLTVPHSSLVNPPCLAGNPKAKAKTMERKRTLTLPRKTSTSASCFKSSGNSSAAEEEDS